MGKKTFNEVAYKNMDDFIYGRAIHPVTCKNGMVIGGGLIYPELNFTLPSMIISQETMPEVIEQYKGIITDALKRAHELYVPGLTIEVELLPPMTYNPSWGVEVVKTVREVMFEYEANHGLKSVMRVTPVDIREDKKSPHMWHGSHWDLVMDTFERCARAGADLLAIESIGGKDMHDDAIVYCEIDKSLFSLGILGTRDMSRLWTEIVKIADRTGTIAAGDTACGFANTAMVLADRGMVPKIFSSIIRVISAVRSLVAIEEGAVGPHKDCGYEGVYVKAITGTPIAMEGKSSACAHLSPIGNISACVADLWSNESVQNIKLLGGMAPTVSMEQLAYDCRLMNTAAASGDANARLMRDWLADSDSVFDPQAYVLRPDVVLEISKEFLKESNPYLRSKAAALAGIKVLRRALADGKVRIDVREAAWLDTMEESILSTPDDESKFIAQMIEADFEHKLDPKKYDL